MSGTSLSSISPAFSDTFTVVPESWLISPAAFWLRSASLRTSAATTAKPLPCSPARAASMAAFSASRLVWRAISSMIEILLAISFIAATASSTHLPLSCASLADLVAILSVCCALSAFCLMLETISSIEEEASSADAACALAPLETCTEAVLMDWLADATSPAMVRISVTVRVRPADHGGQGLHQLVLRRALADRDGQVALRDLFGGVRDVVHGADQGVQVVLDGVEFAVIGVGDLRRNVALADAVHIVGGDIQRADHGVENRVDAAHDVGIGALELIVIAALGELALLGGLGQPGQLLLQALQDDGDVVDGLLHLFVVALVGLGDQFVDLAVGDLRQDAVAFADRQQDGVQHGVHAAHDLGIGALELLGLAAFGELAFLRGLGQPHQFLLQALQHDGRRC